MKQKEQKLEEYIIKKGWQSSFPSRLRKKKIIFTRYNNFDDWRFLCRQEQPNKNFPLKKTQIEVETSGQI